MEHIQCTQVVSPPDAQRKKASKNLQKPRWKDKFVVYINKLSVIKFKRSNKNYFKFSCRKIRLKLKDEILTF